MSKSIGTNIPNTSIESSKVVSSGEMLVEDIVSLQRLLSCLSLSDIEKAVIAVRIHLLPFRTEKLSSPAPMILLHQVEK